MIKQGAPDQERQHLVLKALTFLVEREDPKPAIVALANCAVLDNAGLKPFFVLDSNL